MPSRPPHECGIRCDLCGSDRFVLLHHWPVGDFWNPATTPIAVWRCAHCSLVLLHPVPTAEQLPDRGDWWSPSRSHFRRRLWLKNPWQRARWILLGDPRYRLVRATRSAVKSGRLLDVGCGYGESLDFAGRFYDCVGLEPSPDAAGATGRRGFPVIQSTLEKADIADSSFDIVTMDSVIEHVASPTRSLQKVNSILRMNGVVALKTPKFGGPTYRRRREAWNGFRHGYHTFLFTGQTLAAYLKKTGFLVLRRPQRNRILDDVLILWGRKVRDAARGESTRAEPEAAARIFVG